MTRIVRTKLDEMNLVDKFLFDAAMEDEKIYESVVGILLEKKIQLLTSSQTEKELGISPQLRSVRLDVVGMDVERLVYFAEMQGKNTHNLEKRSRYYQAQVDVSLLPPGVADFNRLPDSCLILVAPFDLFGRGLYRYTFVGTCQECPDLKLQDGAVRVFINTKGKNPGDFSREFLDFMEYITQSTDEVAEHFSSVRLRKIHEKVKEIKHSEKMGVKLMQTWEEKALIHKEGFEEGHSLGVSEGISQGISRGRREGSMEILNALVQDGIITVEEAAKRAGMDVEKFKVCPNREKEL